MEAIITQARINSSRLPNKIFLEAAGRPFLYYHINRLKKANLPIIVATTNNGSEKPIIEFCKENNLLYYCGDEKNVLQRFYQCAVKHHVDKIIRVTSDCPLIDADIIEKGIATYRALNNNCVYYSNALKRTYPRGMDYEIFSFQLLEQAFLNAEEFSDKEHATPYIWKNRSGKVLIEHDLNTNNDEDLRITLDTEEDKILITKLIEEFNASELNCKEIIKILRNNIQLVDINKAIEQKKV